MSIDNSLNLITVLPIVSAVIVYAARMSEVGANRGTIPGKVVERGTLRWFVGIGSFMVVGGLAEFFWRGPTVHWPLFAAGWACALASFGVRRAAISALGKFWSLHVEIREEHRFVRSGPFRWMRHPTYFSMVLELASAALLLNAPITAAVCLVFFVPALRQRLKLEERALVEKFGSAYAQYQRSTPALFPYKWPSHL